MSNNTRLEIIKEWAQELRDYCSVHGPCKGGTVRDEPYIVDNTETRYKSAFEMRWEEFEPEMPMLNAHAQSVIARIQRVASYDPTNEGDYRGRKP